MKDKNNNEMTPRKLEWAKIRLAIWLLASYLFSMLWASITYPFVGFTSNAQNIIYGIIAASPFWISILIYIIIIKKDMSAMKKDE